MLSPQQIIAIVEAAGGTGMLAVLCWLLIGETLITKKSSDRALTALGQAKDAQLHAVTEAKDKEIAELRQTQQQAWQLAERNAGSQETMVKILAGAVSHLASPSPQPDQPATKPSRHTRSQP